MIEDAPALDKKLKHDIEVVVDRLVVRDDLATRLAESFETALKLADGLAYVDLTDTTVAELAGESAEGAASGKMKGTGLPPNRIVFSEKFACPVSGFTIPEIEPRLFSFNAPQGACPACDGLGEKLVFDEELVVPNHALSLKKGAVVPWAKSQPPSPYYMQVLGSLARHYDISLETPWADLPEEARGAILHGTRGKPVTLRFIDGKKSYEVSKPFEGVIGNLQRRMLGTESAWMREELGKYQSSQPCETCGGARLKPEALAVKIATRDISYATHLSVVDALAFFSTLTDTMTDQQKAIAERILKEIVERLGFLNNVGLDYLNLDRTSGTLSGGESQRIRLASQIGSGLSGVLYVLDEPSIGLHQRDNDMLLATLRRLRDLGNTVLVVEHDEDAIRTADYVIDMGPGAGVHGGAIVAHGTLPELLQAEGSVTADYLNGTRAVPVPPQRRKGSGKKLTVPQRHRQQPDRRHRRHPAWHLHLRHRRLRLGQVVLHHRHALRRRRARAERRPRPRRQARQGHRPQPPRQGHRHRPVADRPHPALQPRHLHRRLHPDPRLVRRPARGAWRAATSPAASPSTSRAGGARRARAMACSRSRCTSSPTSTSPATSATAPATTAKRWR